MAEHNELGKWGEQTAIKYLRQKGYYIRHTDWKFKHCDLDIVAIDEEMTTLIIVEVKTRSTNMFGEPEMAITLEKKNNIIKSTSAYIKLYRLGHLDIRYDTIAIIGNKDNYQIRHTENAFSNLDSYYYHEQQRKKRYAIWKRRTGRW